MTVTSLALPAATSPFLAFLTTWMFVVPFGLTRKTTLAEAAEGRTLAYAFKHTTKRAQKKNATERINQTSDWVFLGIIIIIKIHYHYLRKGLVTTYEAT